MHKFEFSIVIFLCNVRFRRKFLIFLSSGLCSIVTQSIILISIQVNYRALQCLTIPECYWNNFFTKLMSLSLLILGKIVWVINPWGIFNNDTLYLNGLYVTGLIGYSKVEIFGKYCFLNESPDESLNKACRINYGGKVKRQSTENLSNKNFTNASSWTLRLGSLFWQLCSSACVL